MPLKFGYLGKYRQLFGFLKTAQSQTHTAGFGRDSHNRRMRPIGGGDGGYEIGNAGPVLGDANAVFATGARIAIPRDLFYGEADYEVPYALRPAREPSARMASRHVCAERLGCPVVNSYLHNDSFPCNHPLWAGPLGYQGSKAGMKLLSRADVVLALGSRLGPFGTLPQYGMNYWPASAKIIQVDVDHRMLGLTRPVSVAVCGDANAAAQALLTRLEAMKGIACDASREDRARAIKSEKDAWEEELNGWTGEKDQWSREITKADKVKGMHPREVLRELEKAMPDNAMVSTDIGNICSVSNSYLRFRHPHSFFAAMSFGNCGYAFPTIIGAKLAAPKRPAVAYVGDGAWGMSFGEILTCVREEIPVTAVVFHNRQWGAEKKNQVDFYNNRFLGVNLGEDDKTATNFSDIAKAMGACAQRIDNVGEVGEALEKACDAQKQGKTTILELVCTRELGDPFRRDALNAPRRLLDKYKKFV